MTDNQQTVTFKEEGKHRLSFFNLKRLRLRLKFNRFV